MTLSELKKARRQVPYAIFVASCVPAVILRASSFEEAKFYTSLVIPLAGLVAAYFYVTLEFGDAVWRREIDAYVGKQIRNGLLNLVPKDLEVTEQEKQDLGPQILKRMTGVFWEAIEQSEALRSQKQFFYSNGILYSTSIDVYLICGFAGLAYAVASLVTKDPGLAYVGAGLIVISTCSRAFVTPHARARHLELSTEQLDRVRWEQGDFVAARFREIIGTWRRERVLR